MPEAGITFNIDKDTPQKFYEKMIENIPGRSSTLVDDLANIYKNAMVSESPYDQGDMRRFMTVDIVSDYERYIYSDVYYFDFVVGGHLTRPPLGGSYMGKRVGTGKGQHWVPGNPFPQRAFQNASGEVKNRLQEFISTLGD